MSEKGLNSVKSDEMVLMSHLIWIYTLLTFFSISIFEDFENKLVIYSINKLCQNESRKIMKMLENKSNT